MGLRTVRTGVGTYQRPDGQWTHGLMNEEVDVNDDDLDRFDQHNGPSAVEHTEPSDPPKKPAATKRAASVKNEA